MHTKLIGSMAIVLTLVGLSACKRQDSSAMGAVYVAKTYTVGTKTTKLTAADDLTLELFLADADQRGVLTTATASAGTYYRRYEGLTVGAKKLTMNGEIAGLRYSNADDLANNVNPATYSYTQSGAHKAVGTYTRRGKTLDLKMGETTWHLTRTQKRTRVMLPYGVADQAKTSKLDKE
ncbi:hypothetical protein [Lacticaseibacillus absianus]|uniref:hypothetical protein n=1 Tax=Lacticaseibacillus absianus TaxID=2729623 RepID=UPI0015CD3EFB|nr:hypothetical protein [Lacticaseibacillus absianus]